MKITQTFITNDNRAHGSLKDARGHLVDTRNELARKIAKFVIQVEGFKEALDWVEEAKATFARIAELDAEIAQCDKLARGED